LASVTELVAAYTSGCTSSV